MTGALAFSGKSILAFLAVAVVLLAIAVTPLVLGRRRADRPDIPPAMSPGPADEPLEKGNLEKLQAWALLCVVLFAIVIPILWLREPGQNLTDEVASNRDAAERGKLTTEQFVSGVNPFGFACVRCHGNDLTGGVNFFNGNFVKVPDLTTVCGGSKFGHALITKLDDVRNTIMQGRANTDMPSWSVRFTGPMDDQQINDIVQYLLSIQKVPTKENVCLNPASGTT